MLCQLSDISFLFISTGEIAGVKMMTISIPIENKNEKRLENLVQA